MYLIRHLVPKEFARGFMWNLVAIKLAPLHSVDTIITYVALETQIEAEQFALTLNPASFYSVARHDQIDLDTSVARRARVLLFASCADLRTRSERGDLSQGPFLELPLPRGIPSLVRRVKRWYFRS